MAQTSAKHLKYGGTTPILVDYAEHDGNGNQISTYYQQKIDADHKISASNVDGLSAVATSGLSSDLTNDAGFITSSDIPTDYVDLTTNQTIEGVKTFDDKPKIKSGNSRNLFLHDFSTMFTNTGGQGSVYAYFKLPDDGKYYTVSISLKDSTKTYDSANVFGITARGGDAQGAGALWFVQGNTILRASFTIAPNDSQRFISIYNKTEATFNQLLARYYIQLEEGTQATPYVDPAPGSGYYDIATTQDLQNSLAPTTPGVATISGGEATFTFSSSPFSSVNNKWLGTFTMGNCFFMIPLYGLTQNTTYKTNGTFVYDSRGSVVSTTINYKITSDNTVLVWSGNSNYDLQDNYVAYLSLLKLF